MDMQKQNSSESLMFILNDEITNDSQRQSEDDSSP